jgi:plastocyanin
MIKHTRLAACIVLTVLLGVTAAFSATHNVDLVGTTFVSSDITIVVNDTVMWTHVSGPAHTVTNGTGPTDPGVGLLFDASLPTTGATFTYTFTTPGEYPYFCRPHFGLGMTGIVRVLGTVACNYDITPASGTLPFVTNHAVSLTNNYGGQTRRVAAHVDVTTASGSTFPNWRAGFTNIAAGSTFNTSFAVSLPALGTLVGNNTFAIAAADVTPAPFNQPPYPPAGDTCTDFAVVMAHP